MSNHTTTSRAREKRLASAIKKSGRTAPKANKRAVRKKFHGVTLVDEYAWLRAENWRDVLRDPAKLPSDIKSYLSDENRYAAKVLSPGRRLKKTITDELRGRIKETDSSVPAKDGDWLYFHKYRKGGEHPVFCRKPDAKGRSSTLLDGDRLSKGKKYFNIADVAHSPDHKLLAWSADDTGSEFCTIKIRNLESGKVLPDVIPDTNGSVIWSVDNSSLFYIRLDENCRATQVFHHVLGTDCASDTLVYEEQSSKWHMDIEETQSGRFAVISISDHETSEAHLIDLRKPNSKPVLVEKRTTNIRYDVEHNGRRLIILTNADKNTDFKIVEAPLSDPSRKNWTDIVPHKLGRMITGMAVFKRHLVRTELEDGLPRIVVRNLRTGSEHTIAFDEEAYDIDLGTVLEFDTDVMRFVYSSLTTPSEIYDYNMNNRKRVLRKRRIIPSGHKPSDYVAKRLLATGHDGKQIPVSLFYHKNTPINGTAPLLLYGYGAYGHTIDASFSANRLSLVDRSFVYAIAHIRGGTEKGWNWYRQGKLTKKKNTFEDFISAGRYLCSKNYSSEGNIVAVGRSAGGMLMGAVVNMAPELFAGVVADVPFVDVINTMTDPDLPLTPPEWLEWGNPIKNKSAFDYMLSYSPYENVKAVRYPAMFVQGGLTDPRVTYWEPAKWVARIRNKMKGGGPVLLKTNMKAGHGGSAGRFERLPDIAEEYVFALLCVQSKLEG